MLRLAVPMAMQQFVMNALNAVDVLMVGQLGDTAVAAVGLANQIWFLMSLFLFGVGSGSAIFSAQFWGRRDLANLRRMLGLALLLGVSGSALFTLAAVLIPETVLRLYSADPAVIALGGRYLRIVGFCYVPTAITTMYGMILRSTRNVKMPMAVSIAALSLKTALAYGLIFGLAGLPALGVIGAAIATCVARGLECAAMLILTYGRNLPAAARPAEMLTINRDLLARFGRTSLPVVLGEILWSLGITTYSAVYAHIGTGPMAAVSITSTIENVAVVPFIALANACAIILGNQMGSGDTNTAASYAWRFLRLAIGGALVVGLLIFACRGPLLTYYRISAEAQQDARGVLIVIAAALWLKAANMMTIVGILRSGGDTRFALFADTAPLWLIGVPMALLGAFVFHLPVYFVVLMVMADEATKFALSLWRVRSGQWINSVVQAF
jgi:putative MATE family efflux protein